MRNEEIHIKREDMWKYNSTLDDGRNVRARVLINDDGSINESSYSRVYKEKNQKADKKSSEKASKKSKKSSKRTSGKNKDGCMMKIAKAPFKLLWWLIKQVLIIVSLGVLSSWLNDNK